MKGIVQCTVKTQTTLTVEGITRDEAEVLAAILNAVGGEPEGPRGVATKFLRTIEAVFGETCTSPTRLMAKFPDKEGSIDFT